MVEPHKSETKIKKKFQELFGGYYKYSKWLFKELSVCELMNGNRLLLKCL